MPKGYNSLNKIPVNFYEIGMCPICSRRLTAECEHRNEQSEVWYAAQILAEQELFTETLPDKTSEPLGSWKAEAAALMDDALDWDMQVAELRAG